MPTFTDSLRGYAFPIHQRDDFICRYCSLDGKESFKDERLSSDYMKKFKFEYIPGIENTMKIIFDGDNYNIRSIVSVQECDIWIEVIAEKDVAV